MVSVIVPVYNAECYLSECIDSILCQTYPNIEVILIDDGSTDDSLSVCQRKAEKDNRIKVIHQENQGVTAARKTGVINSIGNFICFVDSDDTIPDYAIEVLMGKMKENVDIVLGCCTNEFLKIEGEFTREEYIQKLIDNTFRSSLWGNLYRKHLLEKAKPFELSRTFYAGEDYIANLKMASYVRSVYSIDQPTYIYRMNQKSVTHTRTYSLEYEEMYREEIFKNIKQIGGKYEESWYKLQLHLLGNMALNRVKFSYDRPWIQALQKDKHNYSLTTREKIIKLMPNAFWCRNALVVGLKIKRFLRLMNILDNK